MRTRSKLGEQGKDGTHKDNLKHSIYDSKHPFVTKNTAFMATVETRPSVMEVSPKTFGLSKSLLLIDHRIAGDH